MHLWTKIKDKYCAWVILFIGLSVLVYNYNMCLFEKHDRVIQWDIISYYAYLPASVIYHDISLKFQENDNSEHHYIFWGEKQKNGKYLIKTSMGLAMLYAPFFAVAHLYAHYSGVETSGYSWPYKLALLYAAWFYLLLGLYYLRKILLHFVDEKTTALSMLVVVFGTNLFYYSSIEGPMPHVFDFSLISIFFYFTMQWHAKPNLKYSLVLGILSGLISLIRPINILVALLFIFYNFQWKNSLLRFWKQRKHLALLLIVAFLIWMPQLLYWKYITGHWLSFSYGDERFFWFKPHLWDVLFSFRKGLFIYAPVLLFSLWGFILMFRQQRTLFWAITPFILINYYVVSSWWSWWYGGGFGLRAFIDIFGLLAVPIAIAIKQIDSYNKIKKYSLILGFALLLIAGIWHTAKYHYGSIHWDSMTKKAFINNYFHLKRLPDFEQWIQAPDYEAAKKGE